jgi:hypothetical protein
MKSYHGGIMALQSEYGVALADGISEPAISPSQYLRWAAMPPESVSV